MGLTKHICFSPEKKMQHVLTCKNIFILFYYVKYFFSQKNRVVKVQEFLNFVFYYCLEIHSDQPSY